MIIHLYLIVYSVGFLITFGIAVSAYHQFRSRREKVTGRMFIFLILLVITSWFGLGYYVSVMGELITNDINKIRKKLNKENKYAKGNTYRNTR